MKIALLNLLAALVLALCAACGGELSEEGVLKKLTPSMVTVQFRGADHGSGFLVDGNYIVTAAHVMWGLPEIDVVFNDGTLHENLPIAGYDYFTDLAFLGPVDTAASPVVFAEADSLAAEDTAFIIGDPGGPGGISVSEGNFYFTWDWPEANATIVYASAESKSGMSGGPMTNGSGEVIGVLVHRHGDEFASGPSSNTVKDRLEKLTWGEDITILGNRELPDAREGSREFEIVLRDRWDTAAFVSVGSNHTLEFDSYRDVEYGFFDIDGYGVFRPNFRSTQDGLADKCCLTGPGFVEVRQPFDIERHVTLRSEAPLIRRDDPDDGRQLQIGDTIVGAIDTPADIDRYTIQLSRYKGIAVQVNALKSTTVTIDYPDAAPYEIVSGQLYLSEIEYRPPRDAEYTIAVQQGTGTLSVPVGYILTVSPRLIITRLDGPANTLDSPVGEMLRHNFDHPVPTIQIDYPANITGGDREVIAAEVFEQDRFGRTVTLERRDLSHHRKQPDEELSVADYMERSVLSSTFPYKTEKTVTSRREIQTPSGAPVLIEEFEADNGGMKGVRLAYIHEDETGFMAIFYAPGQAFDEWRPVVDYCIGSFSIGDFSVADAISDGVK